MAEQEKQYTKATLIELDQLFKEKKEGGKQVEVQFNPESLKVTFANQIVQPDGGDQSSGTAGRQFVGAGTTKLALQLWFDVNAMEKDPVDDVRRLTQEVVYFMTPQEAETDTTKKAPPGVRFVWGSFMFDGMVEGMDETLEFFSPDGIPLRASISMTLSQQKILKIKYKDEPKGLQQTGQKRMKTAKQGDSLQKIVGKDWQPVAKANKLEDALRMAPGQLVDPSVTARSRAQDTIRGGAPTRLGVGAGVSVGQGLNAALGGAASGSLSIG
jgi:hypothetical protein